MSDRGKTRAELGWPLNAERGTVSEPDNDGFRREVAFEAGHPLTLGTGPSSNYGRGSMKIRFLLHGPKGSTQFLWSTGVTPERTSEVDRWGSREEWIHSAPVGFDVGYHADEPQYEGQDQYDCDYRPGGKCYYDGSGLAADGFLETFLTEGEDAMWAALRHRYAIWFEGASDE